MVNQPVEPGQTTPPPSSPGRCEILSNNLVFQVLERAEERSERTRCSPRAFVTTVGHRSQSRTLLPRHGTWGGTDRIRVVFLYDSNGDNVLYDHVLAGRRPCVTFVQHESPEGSAKQYSRLLLTRSRIRLFTISNRRDPALYEQIWLVSLAVMHRNGTR